MTTFRTIANIPGTVYDADDLVRFFAEDHNAVTEAINSIEVFSDLFYYDEGSNTLGLLASLLLNGYLYVPNGGNPIDGHLFRPSIAFISEPLTGFGRVNVFDTDYYYFSVNEYPVYAVRGATEFVTVDRLTAFGLNTSVIAFAIDNGPTGAPVFYNLETPNTGLGFVSQYVTGIYSGGDLVASFGFGTLSEFFGQAITHGQLSVDNVLSFTSETLTIGGEQNPLYPTKVIERLETTSLMTVRSIAGTYDARQITLINTGSFNCLLTHLDPLAPAEQGIYCPGGALLILSPNETCTLVYDDVDLYWRVLSNI